VKDAKDNPQDTRSRRYRSLLLNGAALLAVFIVVTTYQSRNMLATGDEVAPELRGTTLEGEPYDLEDAGSRPALVYFFAPWCKICAASADNLNRLRRWAEEVRAYVQRHELDITVVLGDSNVARQWQIYAFPSYYVLDSEHRIARRDIGYSSQLGLLWRAWTVDWH
jgi:thiol-disulfide isomerase/thioredoxin